MRRTQPQHVIASYHRTVANGGAIEWEELPSLADHLTLSRRVSEATERGITDFGSTWSETARAELVPLGEPEPFREPLHGMHTREVNEPEVFRHFFGDRPLP